MRNVPPINPDQNVYVRVRSGVKSKTWRRPTAPANRNASSAPTGIRTTRTTTTAINENVTSTICLTSAHATACTPPNIVYSTAGTPMMATDHDTDHPNMAEKTTAGAARIVLTDSARQS